MTQKKEKKTMENTYTNSFEKENTTQRGNTMRKNEIKQALLTLGFKEIEGHYFTSNEGENRFCTGEYDQKEIDTFLKVLSKVGKFQDGVQVVQKDISPEGEEPMLTWFISSPDYDEDQWLYDIRYVNIEFDGDKFSSLWINYTTIENGIEYGPLDWELY